MSDNKRIDAPTGTQTVGHEWDGIEELDTPMPRWWVFTFWANDNLGDRLCDRLSSHSPASQRNARALETGPAAEISVGTLQQMPKGAGCDRRIDDNACRTAGPES